MQSLLYVSRRRNDPAVPGHDVEDIVAVSRSRNASLELTGALAATPRHFAQILEGTEAAIEEVMTSIRRDARHHDLLTAPMVRITGREFHRWSLAYNGESTYISKLLADMLESPAFEFAAHAQNVRNVMAMLA